MKCLQSLQRHEKLDNDIEKECYVNCLRDILQRAASKRQKQCDEA
jgi:hypothetical protein